MMAVILEVITVTICQWLQSIICEALATKTKVCIQLATYLDTAGCHPLMVTLSLN